MTREDVSKRILSLLSIFVNSVSLFVFFVAVGASLSLLLFFETFKLDTSFQSVAHRKAKTVKRSYSGLDKFFLSGSTWDLSPTGNEVQSVVSAASGKVLGTITAGKDRFLLVSQGNSFKILKEGDILDGKRIVKIASLYYQLSDGNKIYLLSPGSGSSSQNLHSNFSVERRAKERIVRLDRTMVEKETADIGKLLKDVNIVPVLRHGETIGYRFLRIRPGTILTKIGFRNGDIVTAVNDIPVRTVEDAFKIYNMLRNEDTVKVEIERRGRKEVIIYEIR
ncbi:PDZ domain-containing protein [Desulfurobacterium sp.]